MSRTKMRQEVRSRKSEFEGGFFDWLLIRQQTRKWTLADRLQKLWKVGHYVLEIKTQDAFGTPLTKTYFFDIEEIKKNKLCQSCKFYM